MCSGELNHGATSGRPRWPSGNDLPASAGDTGNEGLIPNLGRSSREGKGNPFQPGRLQSMGSHRVGHDLATKQQQSWWREVPEDAGATDQQGHIMGLKPLMKETLTMTAVFPSIRS